MQPGDAQGNGAVLLDEKTARRNFPHESAIGRTLRFGDIASTAPWMTVVGVVRDKDVGFKSVLESGKDTSDVLFVSAADSSRGPYFYPIRVAPDAQSVRVLVSRALLAMAPKNTFIRVVPLTEAYESQLRERQFFRCCFRCLAPRRSRSALRDCSAWSRISRVSGCVSSPCASLSAQRAKMLRNSCCARRS